MIVTCIPPDGAPATLLVEIKTLALRYPGEHGLVVVVGERRITFAERVDVVVDLVAELEDLDLDVRVTA